MSLPRIHSGALSNSGHTCDFRMHGHPEQLLHYNGPAVARKESGDAQTHLRQQYV